MASDSWTAIAPPRSWCAVWFRDRPGQGQDAYPGGAAVQKRPGALRQSASRGVNVVDEEDLPIPEPVPVDDGEGPPDIGLPLFSTHEGLGRRVPFAPETEEIHLDTAGRSHRPGQEQGLVETPFPEPPDMEGDRDDDVESLRIYPGAMVVGYQPPQSPPQSRLPAVLEVMDRLQQAAGINGHGAGHGEGLGFPAAVPAELIRRLSGRSGGAAGRTDRRGDITDFPGAGWAKETGGQIVRRPPAGLAPGRKEDVG